MKVVICLLFIAAVCAFEYAPLLELGDPSKHLSGRYIVIFNENVTEQLRDAHIAKLSAKFYLPDHQILYRYHIDTFIGFAAALTDDLLDMVRQNPDVQYVEHDGVMTTYATCEIQEGSVWSLDRVALRSLSDLDGHYHYPDGAGASVFAYIIDTGIYTAHQDFAPNRAVFGFNAVDTNNQDCNGHGTHVASTVGGNVYGVAKKVTLVAVKVLNCAGSGSNAGVIAGIDWSANDFDAKPNTARGVANMSLGGARSTAVNNAVVNAINRGLQFAIAAGNSNTDACNSSPASVTQAVTVASTALIQNGGGAQADQRSSFSNYGPCVHAYAPGSTITAAWIGATNRINTISGTSMASPHVCGVMALLAGDTSMFPNPPTPAALKAEVLLEATKGIVDMNCPGTGVCSQTPNVFLHNGCNM
jgi:subtilisin family serine protease